MYRRTLIAGATILVSAAAVTQIALAGPSSPPRAAEAQGGLSVAPAIVETTARRGARATATITNSSSRTLRVRARARPWRQARSGAVAANRRKRLRRVSVRKGRFTLAPGASRTVRVKLGRPPRRRSLYGALEIVGRPRGRSSGIEAAYRLVSSVRFNATASARRHRLRAGALRRARGRTLALQVRNRGNTVDPVTGSVSIAGARGGRSGTIAPVPILPGKMINLRLTSLRGLSRGTYRATVTLDQAGAQRLRVTRRFRIG